MTRPRVLVVQHQESCPPALFGEWLTEAGCDLEVVRPYAGDPLPPLPDHDAVLVLGGEMGANDDDTVPWLGPLKDGIRQADAAGTPVLGICLGHQLIAVALGGEVAPNPHGQTVGLRHVGWESAVAEDRLLGVCNGEERAIHWNNDVVVRLPEAAIPLARSPEGDLQAARFGANAWGVQSHPEADAGIVAEWAKSDADDHRARGIDQEAALTAIADARSALEAHWKPVATRFAALAAARS